MFSVSICVYGGDDPLHFAQAMESVLAQTVQPNEIVLVVDGPVPAGLEAVIVKYERKDAVRVIRLEKNCGHGIARRTGLENCTCELVALMDADDICAANRFEKQLEAFRRDETLSLVGGQISEFIGEPNNAVGYRQVFLQHEDIQQDIKKRCPINQVTAMFKKSDVQRAGGYQDWYRNEDYFLWLRMYRAGMRFANVPEVLVYVRVGEDMYMRRGGWKYFCSELKLQNYMLRYRVIGVGTYVVNVAKRLVVQVLLPNRLRGYVFKKFARRQALQTKS